MEQAFISRIAKIAKDSNGKIINIIVIHTTNGKPSIVRNYTQLLQDLKNSELIDDNVNSINHPQVSGRTGVLRGLKRGMVSGDINYTKKGDEYLVTAESRVITDMTHPEFGNFAIGDKRVAEEDRAIINGFLDFDPNEQFDTLQANAGALAQAKLAMSGAFEQFDVVADTPVDTLPEDEDEKKDVLPKTVVDVILDTNKSKATKAKK